MLSGQPFEDYPAIDIESDLRAEIERLKEENDLLKAEIKSNIEHISKHGLSVIVMEGAGEENLVASPAVSVGKVLYTLDQIKLRILPVPAELQREVMKGRI